MKIFHSAVVKLTLTYLLIAATVSIVFSLLVYNASSAEISTGLDKQGLTFQQFGRNNDLPLFFNDLENARNAQKDESNQRLAFKLIYLNILILGLAGTASYFLARRTLQPLEEAMDMQNRFTGDASHELRTPLTAIKAEIEVSLRDDHLTLSDAKDVLKSNLEEVEKLQRLSDNLLKIARYESHLDEKVIEIKEVVMDAYKKVEQQAKTHAIDFSFSVPEQNLTADSSQIRELLIILMDNAIKYSKSGGTVEIKSWTAEKNLHLSIADQGEGIKALDLPYIFNRFYRADSSRTKNETSGYGLGLAIASTIVKNHNGHIAVDSKTGKGTTFRVTLPI